MSDHDQAGSWLQTGKWSPEFCFWTMLQTFHILVVSNPSSSLPLSLHGHIPLAGGTCQAHTWMFLTNQANSMVPWGPSDEHTGGQVEGLIHHSGRPNLESLGKIKLNMRERKQNSLLVRFFPPPPEVTTTLDVLSWSAVCGTVLHHHSENELFEIPGWTSI